MKRRRRRQRQLEQRNREAALRNREAARRGGSTLMIVIALLAMLSLVGVVFYTFAAQERSNAEYFVYARKAEAIGDQQGAVFFDWALRQLIVGPEDYEKQSALWGRNHSMIPNMYGRDANPYTGAGVHLIADDDGIIYVDQDYNNISDDGATNDGVREPNNSDLSNFNISPASRVFRDNNGDPDYSNVVVYRNGRLYSPNGDPRFPRDIDVGYTYPDINNLFISFDGRGLDTTVGTGSSQRLRRVIIPSFHRPQYLRDSNGNVIYDWYENNNTATRVLRPHPLHVNVVDGSPRFFGLDGVRGGGDDFPFRPEQNLVGLPGTFGQMGVWTNWGNTSQDDIYELDVDNNGDGIQEGVWLDLGFPVQLLADGTEYITLFSYTVIDADALLNLNVHGNTRQLAAIDGTNFGGGQFISISNQGTGPGQVNLQYAFHANPVADPSASPPLFDFGTRTQAELNAALEQYRLHFGRNPTTRQELSNMEYWFLTRGRPEFSSSGGTQADVTDLFPGRYGEHLTTLYNAIRVNGGGSMLPRNFPQPGRGGVNDQGSADPNSESPRFGHPLDYNGRGRYWNASAYRTLNLVRPLGASNPSVWLRYDGYQVRGSTTLPRWGTAPGSSLMMNTSGDAQIDDADELIVEQDFLQSSDAVFGPEETAYAQLSTADRLKINATSRVEELMPFSQGAAEPASKRAASQRWTAQSWDRKHPGFSRNFIGRRGWEFNRDVDNDGFGDAFPPTFRPTDFANANIGTWNTGTNREPFRNALTLLMDVVNESTARGRPQFRMNLNRLLYSPSPGRLEYRQLTNPADDWRRAMLDRQTMCRDIYVLLYTLGGGRDGKNYADTNDHSNTMTTTGAGAGNDFVYTRDQLRRMAQFAVNLVDSMDRDSVITKFEYDKNLGATVDDNGDILNAGWNLDDDPLTSVGFGALPPNDPNRDADYPEDSIERGVVYGVEAQQLTLSEALWVRVQKGDINSTVMLYDEMSETHEHLFIELRNASPFSVPLAHTASTTAATGKWRMRLSFDAVGGGGPAGPTRDLTFLRNVGPVPAGGQFTIGASDGKDLFPDTIQPKHRPADLRVDFDRNGDFDLIVPAVPDPAPPTQDTSAIMFPAPKTDLDLVHQRDEILKFSVETGGTPLPTKGSLLANIDVTTLGFTVILERRADLDRPTLNLSENPWVEVDRMQVRAKQFTVSSATESMMPDQLKLIKSSERIQPFSRGQAGATGGDSEPDFNVNAVPPPPGVRLDVQFNSIGSERNSRSPSQFTLWQQHFDRDFASVGELLGIPVYGPNNVTKYAGGSRQTANSAPKHLPPLQEFRASTPYPLTAASLMLQPQHPSNIGLEIYTGPPGVGPDGGGAPGPDGDGPPGRGDQPPTGGVTYADPQRDNRWYRLLEFVEVPTRTHLALGDPLNITRVPGRMNLNMFRNPESWAGLLDDRNVVDLGGSYLNDPTSGYAPMPGGQEGTTRDWWEQLIAARDQKDPVTGLYLPGTASSRPFRSLSFLADGNNSIEHTLLRRLPNDEFDNDPDSNRRLLEIGNAGNHKSGSVDPYIRHRLLSKVWGNTTNRSHVFVVFISVDYFEARDMGNGAVRIGRPLDHADLTDGPEHRGVFVVNRSRIEEAVKPGTNKVNWRKLVDFRQTIK